ncbi:MAG: hypothetical protein ABRQ39_04870 [Candidatus Eremiobacterota bacterium]
MLINSDSNNKLNIAPAGPDRKTENKDLPVDKVITGSHNQEEKSDHILFHNKYLPGGINSSSVDSLTAQDLEESIMETCITPAGTEKGDVDFSPVKDPKLLSTGATDTGIETGQTEKPPVKDTFLFLLNSSGETNLAKPLIVAVKNKGYKVKVIHFRENSKEILTSQGILDKEDFIDGTNMFYLPRTDRIFEKEVDSSRVVKMIGTPHHAYCQFAFSKAKKEGIPTVAFVDLGIPSTDFKYRHTFYKTIAMADKIVVPDETIKKRLEASSRTVEEKSDIHVNMAKVNLGGNPGFESFRLLTELNRSRGDAIKQELSIGKDDLVFSFSSQPIKTNAKVLEITGKVLNKLAKAHKDKKIHFLFVPHPRDLQKVGLKNLFGTETDITIKEKCDIVQKQLEESSNVVIHEMPKYTMEKACAISNIVLTESSTTAYECAHADIPSIFVRTPEQGKGTTFPQYKRIPVTDSDDVLTNNIETILSHPPENLSKDLAKVVNSDLTPYMNLLFENTEG